MKEEISKIYEQAVKNNTPTDTFVEQIIILFDAKENTLLSDLMKEQEEIVSSPIRFNGVHVEKIKQVFDKIGIKHDVVF